MSGPQASRVLTVTSSPFIKFLGSRPVESAARRASVDALRVLAFHAVPDVDLFEEKVAHVADSYTPVSAAQVVAAIDGDLELPPRAVWLTFDDGYADVVSKGLPVLAAYGVTATLFVCPAAIESNEPLWFIRVLENLAGGRRPAGFPSTASEATIMAALKAMPDRERRAAVNTLPVCGSDVLADASDLRRWVEAGQHLGNHTWDHPCLPMCEAVEQRRQVLDGRRWLEDHFPGQARVFAFPNGDRSPESAAAASAAGESLALLFDHRLTRLRADRRFELSRLRISADVDLSRFRAIISGAHPFAFYATRRLRRSSDAAHSRAD